MAMIFFLLQKILTCFKKNCYKTFRSKYDFFSWVCVFSLQKMLDNMGHTLFFPTVQIYLPKK